MPDPRRKRRPLAPVRAIAAGSGPRAALSHLTAAVANDSAVGVVIAVVDARGRADIRAFGRVERGELAWIGARLTRHATDEDDWI